MSGNDKPFNPAATISKHGSVLSSHDKFKAAGHPAIWIDHTNAYKQVFEILERADAQG